MTVEGEQSDDDRLVSVPDGLRLVRTTDVFDSSSVPSGLLRAHRLAEDVWGRLVVDGGTVVFVFEDDAARPISLGVGESLAIPPGRAHHVEPSAGAEFHVEFHRA